MEGESGLRAWLGEKCPEINYKTAMSYRMIAVRMVEMLGGATPEVFAALRAPHALNISYAGEGTEDASECLTVDAEIIEKREEIFTEATSRRKLEQMYFDFMRKGDASEGGASAPAQPLPKISRKEAAKRIWAGLMAQLDKRTVMDAIALLPPKVAETCHGRMFELTKLLKEQMAVKD